MSGIKKFFEIYFVVIFFSFCFSQILFSAEEGSEREKRRYKLISTEEITLEALSKRSPDEGYAFFVGQLEGIPFAWKMQKEFITSKAGKKSFKKFYLKYKGKKGALIAFYSFSETILPEIFDRFSEKNWSISDKPVIILSVCHLATGEFSSEKILFFLV